MDKIKEFAVGLIEKLCELLQNAASGPMWWLVIILAVLAAILMLIGLIRLIIKSWKVLIVGRYVIHRRRMRRRTSVPGLK